MASRKRVEDKPSRRPATSPDARENQLVNLAVDLAERQLKDGTASSQVINHFLKQSSSRERLEQERLSRENELLKAKVEQLASAARVEELYADALTAMSQYSGNEDVIELEEYDDYDDR